LAAIARLLVSQSEDIETVLFFKSRRIWCARRRDRISGPEAVTKNVIALVWFIQARPANKASAVCTTAPREQATIRRWRHRRALLSACSSAIFCDEAPGV